MKRCALAMSKFTWKCEKTSARVGVISCAKFERALGRIAEEIGRFSSVPEGPGPGSPQEIEILIVDNELSNQNLSGDINIEGEIESLNNNNTNSVELVSKQATTRSAARSVGTQSKSTTAVGNKTTATVSSSQPSFLTKLFCCCFGSTAREQLHRDEETNNDNLSKQNTLNSLNSTNLANGSTAGITNKSLNLSQIAVKSSPVSNRLSNDGLLNSNSTPVTAAAKVPNSSNQTPTVLSTPDPLSLLPPLEQEQHILTFLRTEAQTWRQDWGFSLVLDNDLGFIDDQIEISGPVSTRSVPVRTLHFWLLQADKEKPVILDFDREEDFRASTQFEEVGRQDPNSSPLEYTNHQYHTDPAAPVTLASGGDKNQPQGHQPDRLSLVRSSWKGEVVVGNSVIAWDGGLTIDGGTHEIYGNSYGQSQTVITDSSTRADRDRKAKEMFDRSMAIHANREGGGGG